MLNELFHIPEASGRAVVRVFNFAESSTTMQPYEIPRNHCMVWMLAIAGGCGGGNGFSAASAAAGGGGGGGPGSMSKGLFPRILLPDVVYAIVGGGGAATSVGNPSRIAVNPTIGGAATFILTAPTGTAGATGTGSGSAAGGGGNIASNTSGAFQSCGLWNALQPANGGAGGSASGATGGAFNFGASGAPVGGGAGGGGTSGATDFAGGNMTGAGLFPTINGGALGGNNPGGDGGAIWRPWMFSGGAGGGSNFAGTGGNGGNGAIGCGGGGGGGGTTGGTGGNGGNGLVVIASW